MLVKQGLHLNKLSFYICSWVTFGIDVLSDGSPVCLKCTHMGPVNPQFNHTCSIITQDIYDIGDWTVFNSLSLGTGRHIKIYKKYIISNDNFASKSCIFSVKSHWDGCQQSGINTGSGNVLVPPVNKPLPEPMLTYYQWGSVAFT